MERERERRYDSAAALADELDRHRRNEPVMAGPPTTWYRTSKFIRRNRLPVGAACAAGDDASAVAERVTDVVLPPPPPWQLFSGPHFGLMFNLPTALDISTDGARLAVLAYGAVVVFDRGDGEDWASALQRRGARVIFPPMEQAEALSLSADGTSALVGSEGEPGHVQRVVLPAFDAKRPRRASL